LVCGRRTLAQRFDTTPGDLRYRIAVAAAASSAITRASPAGLTRVTEQGERSARGQKMQSASEVLTGVALGVFVDRVTNRMFGKTEGRPSGELDDAAERAASKGKPSSPGLTPPWSSASSCRVRFGP
jgi:hypothetical protein